MKERILIDDITSCKYIVVGTEFRVTNSWLPDFKYVNPSWLLYWLERTFDVSSVSIKR